MSPHVWKRTAAATILATVLMVLAVHVVRPSWTVRSDRLSAGRGETQEEHGAAEGATDSSSALHRPRGEIAFQVLDLADGRPVPGARILVQGRSRAEEADAAGIVRLVSTDETRFDVVDPGWTALPSDHNKPVESGILWVHKWIAVRGVVRAAADPNAFDPRKAGLKVLIDGRPQQPDLPDAATRESALSRSRFLDPPEVDGTFTVTVPRVFGVAIAASAPGWKPASQTLDVSGDVTHAEVSLWLERAFRLRGVLRSSEGAPLRDVPLCAYSLVQMPSSEMNRENLALLQPNGGFTGSIDLVTGKARAKFLADGRTDQEGRFDVSVPIDGEVVFVGYPNGHRPVEVDLGILNRDLDLDLCAERVHDSRRTKIVAEEKPLARQRIFVCDLSLKDGDVQPGLYLTLDAESRMVTDWFIVGRRYYLDIAGVHGYVTWKDADMIDVARDLSSLSGPEQR